MRAVQFLSVVFVFGLLATTGFGQIVASIDNEGFFVLNGNGEDIVGVELMSPLGALIPDAANNAAPFTFFLSNTPNQITYGNLGATTVIDGAVKLTARYDPFVNDPDVTVAVGIGATPVNVPFTPGPCDLCPTPTLKALVNDDLNFVLNGQGQTLSEITFRSPSGSLSPATSAAPFAESAINTANQITLASPGSNVTLEGQVVLSAGWSDHLYTRDVEYEYQLVEDGATEKIGPFTLKNNDYDFRLPSLGLLKGFVRDDDHIVIQGEGQPITSFTLSSNGNSLIPSENAGPFDGYGENSAPLTLEGDIVLPTKWDWHQPKTIRFEYDQVGELPSRVRSLATNVFPNVPENGREPLLITLDANNNFVFTGLGQEIAGIDFVSASGALRPSELETTAPFPITLSNKPEQITFGVLGSVEIDGSFVTDFGPVDPNNMDDILINVGFGQIPVPNLFNVECERCEYPAVVVNEDRGLVLENFPEPVTELKFTSDNGALQVVETLPNGLNVISSSANELVIGNETGFDGTDLSGLNAVWGASFDGQVFVSFAFVDGTSFGPLPLDIADVGLDIGAPTVPEPNAGLLLGLASIAMLQLRHRRR